MPRWTRDGDETDTGRKLLWNLRGRVAAWHSVAEEVATTFDEAEL